ncbi:hypothetical protein [Dyadobacter sp. Leaf189]|uniref:hypothetical protein n=1 Tax=Dyadobacter sp. Leaf189 TaxID=1736295 RepID=UPI0012F82578|nr:hypothetical protein [Dyadobacter sp. Leaf189]
MKYLTSLLFLFIGCVGSVKRPEKIDKKVSFSVIFGSCFANDTISLFLDEDLIVDKLSIQSDTVLGLAELYISQRLDSNSLLIRYNTKEFLKPPIRLKPAFDLKILKGSETYYFKLNLKSGRLILVDGCQGKIMIRQSKKELWFE